MRRFKILALAVVVVALVAVPAAYALKIARDTLPPKGFVGVPYSYRFLPDGGCNPYKWKFLTGAFPTGLTIGSDSGIVSGTPTKEGEYKFYLELESCLGNKTQGQFTITIEQKLTVATPSPLPAASVNQPYGPVQLTATGGTVQTWTVQSGTLPPGVGLTAAGVLSGTPTTTGTFEFVVLANGGNGKTDTKKLQLTVSGPLVLGGPDGTPPPTEPIARNYKIGAIVNWGVKATGGTGPYTYSSTPLPAGLTLAADGKVTGTITQAGITLVTFTVTDSKGVTDTLQARFKVKALLAFGATSPPVGTVGKRFSWKVPTTGASRSKTFLASGAFPPGLSLDEATGLLTGTPLAAGTYRLKVWVLGDPGTIISKTFTIRIRP